MGRGVLAGEPPKNPQTFREQVMRELWEQKHSKGTQSSSFVTSNMLIGGADIGVAPDPEFIKKQISQKREDLETLRENFVKKQQRYREQLEKLEAYKKLDEELEEKNGGASKRRDDSDEDMGCQKKEPEWKDLS